MTGKDLQENIAYFKRRFKSDSTVIFRDLESDCGQIKGCLIFIKGMINHEIISRSIILPIQRLNLEKKQHNSDILSFLKKRIITADEIQLVTETEFIVKSLLYGDTLLMIDGYSACLLIQTKGWEKRGINEPDTERAILGSKEAFTESIVTNLTMIRRRIIDSDLKFEAMEVGTVTRTKIFMIYLENVAPQELIDEIKTKINSIKIDAVLDSQYITECISNQPLSIFRTVGLSERPDVITAKLLEGRVAIACDGTPELIYGPYLFYEQFMVNEDYYNNYIFSFINRVLRIFAFLVSTSIPAIYIALISFHQQMLPREIFMSISASREGVPFPSFLEVFLLLMTFELIREAGTRLPKNIGNAISIVGALILGEAAVGAQIVSAPVVIVAALTGITSIMLTQNIHSLMVIRYGLLSISGIFGMYGYIFGVMVLSIYLLSLNSFGVPYMTFIYNMRVNNDSIFRKPFQYNRNNVRTLLKRSKNEVTDK
ncbi:MAG: spore germination protein [Firmicutes bacterium HGW-Firmicutes-1]|nr:MAG: spore germination protein [Firmicutes bacterium HGW-Firmicutes-1]